MNGFFIHAVKAGLFMAIFYTVYYLFLSRDTAYLRNRIYLLTSVLISWLLPFLKLQTESPVVNAEALQWVFTEVLGQAEASGSEITVTASQNIDLMTIMSIFYITGIIFFSARFISGITGIIKLILKKPGNGTIVQIDNQSRMAGFSALGYIFISSRLSDSEKEKVILHEEIHNKLLHYIDIVLCEVAVVLQWMNPFAYMIRYSVRAVHEYHTDREYIDRTGKITDYQQLIFNEIFGTRNIPIASCFSAKSLIKKRIIMMTKKKTKPGAVIKTLIAVPFVAVAAMVFSCNDKLDSAPQDNIVTDEVKLTETVIDKTDNVDTVVTEKKEESQLMTVYYPGDKSREEISKPEYGDMIIIVDGVEKSRDYFEQIPESEIAGLRILRPEAVLRMYGARGAAGVAVVTTKKYAEERLKQARDVFMIVEDMPSFQGGDVQKFSNWVSQNIKYPELAHENGIQGKVFIGFVVEPDGSVSTVTVLRSVDKVLDDEAVRVVQSSPAWKPGYQRGIAVPVRFSITVNFKLSDK
jgi:TonB family protein